MQHNYNSHLKTLNHWRESKICPLLEYCYICVGVCVVQTLHIYTCMARPDPRARLHALVRGCLAKTEERVAEQLVGGDEAHQERALDHRQDLRPARVRVRRVLPAGDEVDARQRDAQRVQPRDLAIWATATGVTAEPCARVWCHRHYVEEDVAVAFTTFGFFCTPLRSPALHAYACTRPPVSVLLSSSQIIIHN